MLLSGPQAGCRLVQDHDGADCHFVGVFMKGCYYMLFLNNYLIFFFHLRVAVGHTGDFI